MKAGTPGEVKALADAAIAAIKEVELLTGGPTSRVESSHLVADHRPAWLKARLEECALPPILGETTAGDEDEPEEFF